MSGILINPIQTTNSPGYFSVQTEGVVQGTYYPDPATRFALNQGTIGGTVPMYGGMAISQLIRPAATGIGQAFGQIIPSTSIANYTGFTVMEQAVGLIVSPQNQVPVGSAGQSISYFRKGSLARIAVACAPVLVDLDGGLINQQVSWDFNGQQLVPFVAAYPANVITAASWASTGGGESTFTTTTAHGVAVGDYFTISGMTPAGYNSDYIAQTGTTGSTLVGIAVPNQQIVTPGTATGFGTLVAGGGALPVTILEVFAAGCLTISASPAALGNYYNWNPNGSAAVIQI